MKNLRKCFYAMVIVVTPCLVTTGLSAAKAPVKKTSSQKKSKKNVAKTLPAVSEAQAEAVTQPVQAAVQEPVAGEAVVSEVSIEGNKYLQSTAIEKRLPFKKGEPFNQEKTADAIHHTYALGYFKQVQIERSNVSTNVKVVVRVQEKKLLEKIEFTGNKQLTEKKLREKLNVDKLTAIDEEQLAGLIVALKKLYKDEHHHSPVITYQLVENPQNPDKVTAVFTIQEGVKTRIKRVEFDGIKSVPEYKVRGCIFTRERWLLSFMDDAGKYNPEMLDVDKRRVEMYYQDQGYWNAKVTGVDVEKSDNGAELSVTFYVKEGDRYLIRYLAALGDDDVSEKDMLAIADLKEGQPVSRTKVADAVTAIKALWGTKGYIHADVYPKMEPNEATKELDISFIVEKGEKFFVNRIDITGNKITRDKVIRRHIMLEEGDLITTTKLEHSKQNIELLGFFEREGVTWKIHKVGKNKCDLELVIQEAKTGHLDFNMSYGNDQHESERSMKFGVNVEKRNMLGMGWDLGGMIQASRKRMKRLAIHWFDPYFLDRELSAFVTGYVKRDEYDQWTDISATPLVTTKGGFARLGFYLPAIDRGLQVDTQVGIENIKTPCDLRTLDIDNRTVMQDVIDRRFQRGTIQWFGAALVKDMRNHRVYPNQGYRFELSTRAAIPGLNHTFSFWQNEIEASWYTPLIGPDALVFAVRGKAGMIYSFPGKYQDKRLPIPYKELYHMGGQDTVRGFNWGGVGPALNQNGSPLGARKMLLLNTELQFPIVPDYSMKGHLFYDAGAGWDTPLEGRLKTSDIKRNHFNIRHSVGFGINLVKPFPAKIDWGYKLDRDKKAGESASEFHISMNAAW